MQSKKKNIVNLPRGGRDLGWGNNVGVETNGTFQCFILTTETRVKAGNVAGVHFFLCEHL